MLVNLPLKNQLNDANSDGNPDNNEYANCVAEVLASIAQEASGRAVHGGDLKDAAYGADYKGATNPTNYAKVMHDDYGVDLEMVQGDGSQLVQVIISHLQNHTAVAGAIPSKWGNTTAADIAANGGPTHEIGFCDYDGVNLTAMNPWPVDGHNAFFQTMPVAWWASRLVYGHVHVAHKENATVAVDVTGLGAGFAAFAQEHNVSQVSGGEHYYTADDSFCGLSDGDVLWYNKQSDKITSNVGAWVATVLWQQRESYRTQVEALQVEVANLTKQLQDAQNAPKTPAVPADMHDTLASIVNTFGPLVQAVSGAQQLMKELGY